MSSTLPTGLVLGLVVAMILSGLALGLPGATEATLGARAHTPTSIPESIAASKGAIETGRIPGAQSSDAKYDVIFSESGLPAGTPWSIEIGLGCSFSHSAGVTAGSQPVSFNLTNGTYAFAVLLSGRYVFDPTPSGGSVVVAGTGVKQTISFTATPQVTFFVGFYETGLGNGSHWGIDMDGAFENATLEGSFGQLITFTIPNGTNPFSMVTPVGYVAQPYENEVTMQGVPTCLDAPYALGYLASFVESGLPNNTSWSVIFSTAQENSTNNSIVFLAANGTAYFTVLQPSNFYANPLGGSLDVNGSPVVQKVQFSSVNPADSNVTFSEQGLPAGTSWSVTLDLVLHQSLSPTTSFWIGNGTFAFSVGSVPGYTASPGRGDVLVSGTPINQSIRFTPIPPVVDYAVTFTESGLPLGTNWTVSLAGVERWTMSSQLTFSEPNGSYEFSISNMDGFAISPSSGGVTVMGGPAAQRVTFYNSATPNPPANGTSSASHLLAYVVTGGVLTGVVASTSATLIQRRRQRGTTRET
jgi:hypothetical protein